MLHLAILPFHEQWTTFLASLSLVVVDEAHTYRGVLGSHISQLFRRLNRICARYAARPNFVFCTATVGNPEELAGNLLGRELVQEKGKHSPREAPFLHQFPAQQIARQFLRVADRRRAENKIGAGGVAGADPVQAAEKLADMRSEHAAIGMRLIHNHQRERRKERRPLLMEGQNRQMQHFGVGNQDIGRVLADLAPEMIGRIAVIDGDGRPRRFGPMPGQLPKCGKLILRQRLQREQHQRPAVRVLQAFFQYRQAVAQCFAAGGGRGDHHVAPGADSIRRQRLMAVERRDPPLAQHLRNGAGPRAARFAIAGLTRGQHPMVRHLPREPLGRQQRPYVISHVVLHERLGKKDAGGGGEGTFLEKGPFSPPLAPLPSSSKDFRPYRIPLRNFP